MADNCHTCNAALHCDNDNCAAITVNLETNRPKQKFYDINLNMNTFVPSDTVKTLFNLNVDPLNVKESPGVIDLCCPAHDNNVNVTNWIGQIDDVIPRIPCNISAEDFIRDYIIPREAVMLTGCVDEWKASKDKWTYKGLLARYDKDVKWKADVSLGKNSPITMEMLGLDEDEWPDIRPNDVRSYDDVLLSGKELLNLMQKNVTIRVFERVGIAPRRKRRDHMSTEKPDLFQGWGWPRPIPEDLYKSTFGGSDYQWLIMSETKTGTHVHMDPDLTDAWNALLYGHKVI